MRVLCGRLALLLTLCLGLAGVLAPSASAAEPGAASLITWWIPTAQQDKEISMLKAAGAKWIRVEASWGNIESDGKGKINSYSLNVYDTPIDKARAAGLNMILLLDEVPYWASADPNKYIDSAGTKHWNKQYRPVNMQDYGDFVKWAVAHYKAKGIQVYEIWNEPNLGRFWPSGVNATAYTEMLKSAYTGAKAADPTATVVSGGLANNDYDYLTSMYKAGAHGYMDAVAVHPYAFKPYPYFVSPTTSWTRSDGRIAKEAFNGFIEVKKTMDSYGDSAKQLWFTEFGYPTTTTAGGVSEATQASWLTSAFKYVESYPYVKALFWYQARDLYVDDTTPEARFGLMHYDYSPKPSYDAFKTYALGQPAPPPPPPPPAPALDTTITAGPSEGSRVKTHTPKFSFSSNLSSATFQCRIGTAAWYSCTSPHTTAYLSSGSQSFSVRAVNPATGELDQSPAVRNFRVR
jgi:hypothetical protein